MCKTYQDFPEFYTNPFIQSIANNKKWTVSDTNKRPIDIQALKLYQKIIGAKTHDETTLMTLTELCEFLPNATNNAYYIDSTNEDEFILLDIEPQCPDNIKNKFLDTNYLYGEKSMSGHGLHLVYEKPNNYYNFDNILGKLALKEEHKWYEILLNHWVTFTRNTIAKSTSTNTINEVFTKLANNATPSITTQELESSVIDIANIPDGQLIINSLLTQPPYPKTPDDFYNDYSRFEYGHTGYYYVRLKLILSSPGILSNGHTYTDNEKINIMYQVNKQLLPFREKHNTKRNNIPWLMYQAQNIIGKDTTNARQD